MSTSAHGLWTGPAGVPAGTEGKGRVRRTDPTSPLSALIDWLPATKAEARYWKVGATAVERIGASLERIARRDGRWRAPIHSVAVGERACDVAHVLVGAGGVFTINVKQHPHGRVWADGDRVEVDGDDWRYVAKNRREAGRAARLLSDACGFAVPVQALIVIVGAKHVSVGRPPENVHILEACYLPRWLRSRRAVHPDAVVRSVYEAACRSTVWRAAAAR